jgi:hypothetical protein
MPVAHDDFSDDIFRTRPVPGEEKAPRTIFSMQITLSEAAGKTQISPPHAIFVKIWLLSDILLTATIQKHLH